MTGLRTVAERAVRERCRAIMARIVAAIADHAPDARIESSEDKVQARGRGLKRQWLSEPGLRFARRIQR